MGSKETLTVAPSSRPSVMCGQSIAKGGEHFSAKLSGSLEMLRSVRGWVMVWI
jgi:hypothetical protein